MDTGEGMDGATLLALAILTTAGGGAGLAWFLVTRTGHAPGARPLAVFLLLVGLWALGLLLPDRTGRSLLALAPLAGAVFVHFALRLADRGDRFLGWVYGAGAGATLLALIGGTGEFIPWPGCDRFFRYQGTGLGAAGITLSLAALGHALLLDSWRRTRGKRHRQIGVALVSSALGLGSVVALAFPVLGVEHFPWTLLLLPGYVFGLGYGVVRYELMAANHWARQALTWAMVTTLAVTATAVPLGWLAAERSWLVSVLAVVVAMLAWTPLQRLAERLIFPSGEISAAELSEWRDALDAAADETALATVARVLLHRKFGLPEDAGSDWSAAPPGPRRLAELIDTLKSEAGRTLERRRALAEQRRLAELGALAATVAHDLRNPMNIIAMAVADAEPASRAEVAAQLARMTALVRDLLDYAKPWTVEPTETNLAAVLRDAGAGLAFATEIPPGLSLRADRLRLGQVLSNLLANASTASGRVLVTAETCADFTVIDVCDDGPGIPEAIRESLFRPFVSRGQGGTGLGLAIVARIMTAHGGSVTVASRPGWTTCFRLGFHDDHRHHPAC